MCTTTSVVVPEDVARRARESEESGYVYVTAVATTSAPGAKSIVVEGDPSLEEARRPKKDVVTGEASGPWYAFIGYSPIAVEVTSLDGKDTKTYRVVVEHGSVDELTGVSLKPGDGQLTLSWGENTGDAPPNLYWARWRKARDDDLAERGHAGGLEDRLRGRRARGDGRRRVSGDREEPRHKRSYQRHGVRGSAARDAGRRHQLQGDQLAEERVG